MKRGFDRGRFDNEYKNIKLVIDDKEKVCDVYVNVSFEFEWSYEPSTRWEKSERLVDNLDICIEDIGVVDESGYEYSDEQCEKILEDNIERLEDLVRDEAYDEAYDMDWETW